MASYRELAGALAALCRAVRRGNLQPDSTLLASSERLAVDAMAGRNTETPWTAFERVGRGPVDLQSLYVAGARYGMKPEAVRLLVQDEMGPDSEVWINSRYQVMKRAMGDLAYLSIKRIDQQPIRWWRDLQRIKNELVGPECEAVELFPAESRLIDSANQYHLWVFTNPETRMPVGFTSGRVVADDINLGEGQEPFES
jgi:hypothetical protein